MTVATPFSYVVLLTPEDRDLLLTLLTAQLDEAAAQHAIATIWMAPCSLRNGRRREQARRIYEHLAEVIGAAEIL